MPGGAQWPGWLPREPRRRCGGGFLRGNASSAPGLLAFLEIHPLRGPSWFSYCSEQLGLFDQLCYSWFQIVSQLIADNICDNSATDEKSLEETATGQCFRKSELRIGERRVLKDATPGKNATIC